MRFLVAENADHFRNVGEGILYENVLGFFGTKGVTEEFHEQIFRQAVEASRMDDVWGHRASLLIGVSMIYLSWCDKG